MVVFNSLAPADLRRIVDLELEAVQKRVCQVTAAGAIGLTVSDSAKDFLLREGTDLRYGARHLKRAMERNIVQPLSNLIATGQALDGDQLFVDLDSERARLVFLKEFSDAAPQVESAAA
jgi:ATP-dependent Clp protease ATP-binding subunit ClpA